MSSFRIPLCRLMERKSENGRTYFTGYLGDAKILIFKDEKCDAPRFGSVAEWQMYVVEKQAARKPDDAEQPR